MSKLLVVKVGTNTLLDDTAFARIGGEVRDINKGNTGVIVVSSGAISAGVQHDGKRREDITTPVESQLYATLGWPIVTRQWQDAMGADTLVAPMLITKENLDSKSTRTKLLGTLALALERGVVPLINENDALCDDEIRFGDNDTLAAHLATACVSSLVQFDKTKLILLTNRDGLYKDPDDASSLIRVVSDIEAAEQFAGSTNDVNSRGGMITKVQAAKIARSAGVETYIANGATDHAISRAASQDIGTYFPA
jgi:glutamate 5-kinase